MTRKMLLRCVAAALCAPAAAGLKEASAPGLRSAYYGEGGGVLPTPAGPAASYLETRPVFEAGPPPAAPPHSAASSRKGNGAFLPRDPASKRYRQERLNSAPQPAEDRMKDAARSDYEKRILGADTGAAAAPLEYPAQEGVYGRQLSRTTAASGETFVAVDMESSNQSGDLRDAVAGLSVAAGFRHDARFPAQRFLAGGAERVSLRGWIPTNRIGAAARAPGVLRLEFPPPGPSAPAGPAATAAMLVGIRIPARAKAAETFQRVIAELSQSAEFRWTHTVGFQAVPGSPDVALLVIGEIPIARLSRLMGHPDVLKIASAPHESALTTSAETARQPGLAARFAHFILQRAPYLLVITFLLLIPSVGGSLIRGLKTFIPYH